MQAYKQVGRVVGNFYDENGEARPALKVVEELVSCGMAGGCVANPSEQPDLTAITTHYLLCGASCSCSVMLMLYSVAMMWGARQLLSGGPRAFLHTKTQTQPCSRK